MDELPVLSGKELVKLLEKAGFYVVGQKWGHVSLRKAECRIVVPLQEELAATVLSCILKECGLERNEMERLIRGEQ